MSYPLRFVFLDEPRDGAAAARLSFFNARDGSAFLENENSRPDP
jgi:hypothetical protein